jgi:hypothetical protein
VFTPLDIFCVACVFMILTYPAEYQTPTLK